MVVYVVFVCNVWCDLLWMFYLIGILIKKLKYKFIIILVVLLLYGLNYFFIKLMVLLDFY